MKGVNKAVLTELKSLANPPVDVIRVVSATAILLGHSVDEAKRWGSLKKILGQATLCQRIESLDVSTVPVEAAQAAQTAMKDVTPEKIKNSSLATFSVYQWNKAVIEAVLARYGEEEISKAQPQPHLT